MRVPQIPPWPRATGGDAPASLAGRAAAAEQSDSGTRSYLGIDRAYGSPYNKTSDNELGSRAIAKFSIH